MHIFVEIEVDVEYCCMYNVSILCLISYTIFIYNTHVFLSPCIKETNYALKHSWPSDSAARAHGYLWLLNCSWQSNPSIKKNILWRQYWLQTKWKSRGNPAKLGSSAKKHCIICHGKTSKACKHSRYSKKTCSQYWRNRTHRSRFEWQLICSS